MLLSQCSVFSRRTAGAVLLALSVGLLAGCSGKRASNAPTQGDTAATGTQAPADTSTTGTLTDAQRNRLGPRLQRMMASASRPSDDVEPVGTRNGVPIYSVTVQCSDAEALRRANLPLNSVQGSIITARWTLQDIRTAATIEEVQRIQAAAEVQKQ